VRFVTEYRNSGAVRALVQQIHREATQEWRILEVCGGQTHAIIKWGLDILLENRVQFLHGPGCPVCVTPPESIDTACALAHQSETTLCTFGDMIRVPGTRESLLEAKARGGDVRAVYSPLDALAVAQAEPQREVVLFGIGFETTAPTTAATVLEAERLGVKNFSVFLAHRRVPPALATLLEQQGAGIDGVLAAGHVCTVMGTDEYLPLAHRFKKPVVVTGFEPVCLLGGVLDCIRQLERGQYGVTNQYQRVVNSEGNPVARAVVEKVFHYEAAPWRGFSVVSDSGLRFRERYLRFDALSRLMGRVDSQSAGRTETLDGCRAGEVLTGVLKPDQCEHFSVRCTPEIPLGAPMVSGEGACQSYFQYRSGLRHERSW
jgi:hydrogenase expression/formation protein HypD